LNEDVVKNVRIYENENTGQRNSEELNSRKLNLWGV